jgi:hypothetical protein
MFRSENPVCFPRELERAVYDAQICLDASSFKNKNEGYWAVCFAFSLIRDNSASPHQMRKPVA